MLSLVISPSEPVNVYFPAPLKSLHSISRVVPPSVVHATALTTPSVVISL